MTQRVDLDIINKMMKDDQLHVMVADTMGWGTKFITWKTMKVGHIGTHIAEMTRAKVLI